MRKKFNQFLAIFLLAIPLLGCGFQPLYADRTAAQAVAFDNIDLVNINAPSSIKDILTRSYQERKALSGGGAPEYHLVISARESAQRLAVQIDASVTRYNYALRASYTLTRMIDGKVYRGNTDTVASFNVVPSQYSTLFAENTARKKAARALVENIEREILLILNDPDNTLNQTPDGISSDDDTTASDPIELDDPFGDLGTFGSELDVEYIR